MTKGVNELERLVIDVDALAKEWGLSRKEWSTGGGIDFGEASRLLKDLAKTSGKLSRVYERLGLSYGS